MNWFKSTTTRASPWNAGKNRDISIQKYNIKIIKQTIWTITYSILFCCQLLQFCFALATVSSNIENILNNFLSFSLLPFRSLFLSLSHVFSTRLFEYRVKYYTRFGANDESFLKERLHVNDEPCVVAAVVFTFCFYFIASNERGKNIHTNSTSTSTFKCNYIYAKKREEESELMHERNGTHTVASFHMTWPLTNHSIHRQSTMFNLLDDTSNLFQFSLLLIRPFIHSFVHLSAISADCGHFSNPSIHALCTIIRWHFVRWSIYSSIED